MSFSPVLGAIFRENLKKNSLLVVPTVRPRRKRKRLQRGGPARPIPPPPRTQPQHPPPPPPPRKQKKGKRFKKGKRRKNRCEGYSLLDISFVTLSSGFSYAGGERGHFRLHLHLLPIDLLLGRSSLLGQR